MVKNRLFVSQIWTQKKNVLNARKIVSSVVRKHKKKGESSLVLLLTKPIKLIKPKPMKLKP
jgi:hypothetical protein